MWQSSFVKVSGSQPDYNVIAGYNMKFGSEGADGIFAPTGS